MKLEVLKAYRTERGRAVVVQGADENGDYLVWHASIDKSIWHESDGRVVSDAASSHRILGEWSEPRSGTVYVDIYSSGHMRVVPVKINQSEHVTADGDKRIACVRVEWVEGQGLESGE